MSQVLADSYVHGLDPFAIQFTESFGLRWYGLSYAAGFLIGWVILRWFAKTGRTSLTVTAVGDLMFYIIAGVLLGGRLGYAVFYEPGLLVEFTGRFPFWGLLALTKGGMSSHGGMIGVTAACGLFFVRHRAVRALHLIDLAAFIAPPGLCLGRLANFVNGELWGRALPAGRQADPPGWSVKYPAEILQWRWGSAEDVEKLRALDALRPIVGGSDAKFLENVVDLAADAGRPEHEQVVAAIQPLLTAFYPSQIFQALTDGPMLFLALVIVWRRPRKPGVVGAWFLVVYGALRIASEQFRQPDAGVALLFDRISRGQTLSGLMIVAGLVCLVVFSRRDAPKHGGLLPART